MNRRDLLTLLAAAVMTSPAQAASSSLRLFSRRTPRKPLLIAGSTSMSELNDALAAGFAKVHPDVDVVTETGSSLSALIALKRHSIDVAAMNRDLQESEDEKGLHNYLIARTGIDVLVSHDSPVTALTSHQVRGILTGEIDNWSQLGGARAPIQVLSGARSRRFVEEDVLASGNMVAAARVFSTPMEAAEAVAGDPHAVGFVLHTEKWGEDVRRITVDGVDASRATMLSNRYAFTQSLYLVVMDDDPESPGRLFADFARGDAGQKIAAQLQFLAT